MSSPILYVFAISHFCEKARWALDYLGVEYDLVHLAPGANGKLAEEKGLPASSLPILFTGTNYLQGSGTIIDWADSITSRSRTLTPANEREECLALEKRLDEVVGVHVRRMFYSEALIEHADTVEAIFTKDLSAEEQSVVSGAWPFIQEFMIDAMDLGFEQGEESKQLLEEELEWLDGLFADGRRFLVGDQFSRADVTLSSLFSRTADAPEHPAAAFMQLPPRA